jgi:hypothetical protein
VLFLLFLPVFGAKIIDNLYVELLLYK